jgi:hypothetical protein
MSPHHLECSLPSRLPLTSSGRVGRRFGHGDAWDVTGHGAADELVYLGPVDAFTLHQEAHQAVQQ